LDTPSYLKTHWERPAFEPWYTW